MPDEREADATDERKADATETALVEREGSAGVVEDSVGLVRQATAAPTRKVKAAGLGGVLGRHPRANPDAARALAGVRPESGAPEDKPHPGGVPAMIRQRTDRSASYAAAGDAAPPAVAYDATSPARSGSQRSRSRLRIRVGPIDPIGIASAVDRSS
jgi:hypothetical protein